MPNVKTLLILVVSAVAGCWFFAEPETSEAHVMWVAHPDTVRVGALFSLEFGGPISQTACGRLDTAQVVVTESSIELSAQRRTINAICAPQNIGFYQTRGMQLSEPGRYEVRNRAGVSFGSLVAIEEGDFSRVRTRGEGTVRQVGDCLLFGPGWVGGQHLLSIRSRGGVLTQPPAHLLAADPEQVVFVRGDLRGFDQCGPWGSRPVILVDTAWVTERTIDDIYP